MQKLSRSLIAVGGLALLAACGDDVSITPPPEQPAATIAKVDVIPQQITIAVGEKFIATASVTVNPGTGSPATTVTWSSADAAIASVAASGEVTGVAPGTTTIRATSTADPSKIGAAAVTVGASQPATVSIKSITTGVTNIPVNIANVGGQIDVTLNMEPGDQTVQRVEVLLDGAVAASQAFSLEQSVEAIEAAAVELVLSINTADFNQTTGAVTYPNGARQLSARAILVGGTQVATPSMTLQFNNFNRFVETLSYSGTTATATGSNGLVYNRGSLVISVLPVIYGSGISMAAGTATFGSVACDASGIGPRSVTLAAPAGGSGAWTGTLNQTATTPGAGNAANYEYNAAAIGCGTGGENAIVAATDNNGNQVFNGNQPFSTPANPAPAIRLDNRAPGAPTFVANPNVRQNGWINANVGLVGSNTSATDNDWMANGAADLGVGGYVRMLRVGNGPLVDEAIAAEGSATPTLPAPTAANNTLCAVATAADLLGNESALPTAGTNCLAPPAASFQATGSNHLSFGVDIAPPTIAFSAGLASNARLNGGTVGGEFQVTVTDTGTVGNSGMLSGAAVVGTVQIRNAAGTVCFVGATAACNPVSVNAAPAFPLVPTTTVAASTTTGYYTYNAVSQDAAGNQSAPVTRVVAYDPAANVPALTQALYNVPLNGPTVTFNANAGDNFDLWDVTYSLTYAGGLPGDIIYPAVVLNQFNAAALVNSNVPAGITVTGFVRQIENVTGNGPLAVGGAFKPIQLNGTARDQAGNPSPVAITAIPPASVTNGVSFTAAAAPLLTNSWTIVPFGAAQNISDGAATTPANPTSVTFTARACGPTATYASPFSVVDFYVVTGGNLQHIGTASAGTTVDDGSAFGRCHPFSFTWTPGTAFGLGAQTVHAVGVSAAGDGLFSAGNAQVTITNP